MADHAFRALEARFTGFERGPVEMVEERDVHVPEPRVGLPYKGPALHELWTTTRASADLDRSTIRLQRSCDTCGTEFWEVHGAEHRDSAFDPERRKLVRSKVGRDQQSGIYVRRDELDGADIFRVAQFPAWVFCSDAVRDFIRERRFTNVEFLEMGETT